MVKHLQNPGSVIFRKKDGQLSNVVFCIIQFSLLGIHWFKTLVFLQEMGIAEMLFRPPIKVKSVGGTSWGKLNYISGLRRAGLLTEVPNFCSFL